MFLRKNVFHLIFFCSLIFLLGYLTFFLFTSKSWACTAPGGSCTENWECCDDCGRNYCVGNTLKNDCQPGVCSSGICTLGIGRPRTHTEQCDCWCTQPIGNVDGYCDGDSRRGTQCDSYGCCENVDGTGREGTCYKKYDCYGSCNFDRFVPNGCGNGQCACGEDADNCAADCAAPTPTPSGSPSPTPSGSPSPTPSGSPSPSPSPSPSLPPNCNNTPLTITPNPANVGQQMTFQYNSNQSTYVGNTWSPSNSVTSCNEQLANYRVICTAQNATASPGTWTHSWGWNNWNQCSKTATYTINNPITPWIQVTGDVHSNVRIYAPGGP